MSRNSLEGAYRSLLRNGRLSANPGQNALVERLTRLQDVLAASNDDDPVTGLYIYGGVGTGKSRIADLFAANLPNTITRRRAHFHEFMLDIHSRLHRARSASGYSDDPLPKIGRQVRDESRVLCFDEFQVTDIADAMILQRLFGSIWANGGVMVSTSNRHPDALYENGLNRALFLPFIAQLKSRAEVWQMEGEQDYRMLASGERQQTFFTESKPFQRLLKKATTGQTLTLRSIRVMMGRKLSVIATGNPDEAGSMTVWASFAELCETSLGAADYHALCHASNTIFLEGLRRFRSNELDFARRFITLIDLAYESKTRVIIYSHQPLQVVFQDIVEAERVRVGAKGSSPSASSGQQMRVQKGGGSSSSMMSTFVGGDTEWSATGLSEASLATGGAGETDVVFAIGRALSRLNEMGSAAYGQLDET